MLQYYHATHGSSHALNLFYINSLDQMQQSRGGPNKDTIYSSSRATLVGGEVSKIVDKDATYSSSSTVLLWSTV